MSCGATPAAGAGTPPAGVGQQNPGAFGPRLNPYGQYTDGWQVLHPNKKMVGRAVTMAFMPARPDLDAVVNAKAKAKGIDRLGNQTVVDLLQPGDVLVVDLYGKKEGGTIVGDNLFHYIMRVTKSGGLVVDGSVRDLEGIRDMDMPAYFRAVHPSFISGATLAAVNVPVRCHRHAGRCGDRRSRRRDVRSAAAHGGHRGPRRYDPHPRRVDPG